MSYLNTLHYNYIPSAFLRNRAFKLTIAGMRKRDLNITTFRKEEY